MSPSSAFNADDRSTWNRLCIAATSRHCLVSRELGPADMISSSSTCNLPVSFKRPLFANASSWSSSPMRSCFFLRTQLSLVPPSVSNVVRRLGTTTWNRHMSVAPAKRGPGAGRVRGTKYYQEFDPFCVAEMFRGVSRRVTFVSMK